MESINISIPESLFPCFQPYQAEIRRSVPGSEFYQFICISEVATGEFEAFLEETTCDGDYLADGKCFVRHTVELAISEAKLQANDRFVVGAMHAACIPSIQFFVQHGATASELFKIADDLQLEGDIRSEVFSFLRAKQAADVLRACHTDTHSPISPLM